MFLNTLFISALSLSVVLGEGISTDPAKCKVISQICRNASDSVILPDEYKPVYDCYQDSDFAICSPTPSGDCDWQKNEKLDKYIAETNEHWDKHNKFDNNPAADQI